MNDEHSCTVNDRLFNLGTLKGKVKKKGDTLTTILQRAKTSRETSREHRVVRKHKSVEWQRNYPNQRPGIKEPGAFRALTFLKHQDCIF